MKVTMAYLGRSGMVGGGGGAQALSLAPNLSREPVAFDAPLLQPLRFREAISALHDVVINDLRFKPRDKTAYEQWKKDEAERLGALRRATHKQAKDEILAKRADVPKDLERVYKQKLRTYWSARQRYSNYLLRHDMELWRKLMPCDPVITVANDVVFFECFSADESSYGCLTVNRDDGFGAGDGVQLGTTNVDYSWDLYNNFQTLRSYRETRFKVDPAGFEVATEGNSDYREEKIDLPQSWLRGFMQVQQAMSLPATRVSLTREAVYSLLVWLKRHRAKTSPRAVRFELLPGQTPRLVLEPWEKAIDVHGVTYDGPPTEPIRVWGRQRLLVLARLLPLVDSFDVHLLGTGLPHFWVARMGEMRLTLGLSGWTTNDWTRGSSLDLVLPPAEPSESCVTRIADLLRDERSMTFDAVASRADADPAEALAALGRLAHSGQVIRDLTDNVYRYRQIMPRALGEAEIGPESSELVGAKDLLRRGRAKITGDETLSRGARLVTGKVDNQEPEVLIDGDGRIKRGKCKCSHYYQFGLRAGPCRHMIALHRQAVGVQTSVDRDTGAMNSWFERMKARMKS